MIPKYEKGRMRLPGKIREDEEWEIHLSTDNAFRKAIQKSTMGCLFRRGFVYLADTTRHPMTKIGFSTNLRTRMASLNARCTFFAPASYAHEMALHRMFRHRQHDREWYHLTEEDIADIMRLLEPSEFERDILTIR